MWLKGYFGKNKDNILLEQNFGEQHSSNLPSVGMSIQVYEVTHPIQPFDKINGKIPNTISGTNEFINCIAFKLNTVG